MNTNRKQPASQIKPQQQRQLYMLLRQAGLDGQKENLVNSYTGGRTTHTGEMTEKEAAEMITYLGSYAQPDAKAESCNKMRRKIISQAHRMGWQAPSNSPNGGGPEKPAIDMERLNAWCVYKGYLTKELNEYTYEELPVLVSQFNEVYKSFLKGVGK